jgi:hypothetical protein
MSRAERRALVERAAPALPISRQCRLLSVSRASVYRQPAEINEEDCTLMALIDRQYLARPYYGSRRMAAWLATQGHVVNRKRRLMRLAGLVAIYQRPNTSKPAVAHKIYPYLLGGISIERVNRVWCADVTTYIPMAKGFLYLVAIMDLVSRAVLAWRLSKHARRGVLRRGPRGSAFSARPTRDLQHRQSMDQRQFPGGLTPTPIDCLVGWRRKASRCGLTHTPIDQPCLSLDPSAARERLAVRLCLADACDPRRA